MIAIKADAANKLRTVDAPDAPWLVDAGTLDQQSRAGAFGPVQPGAALVLDLGRNAGPELDVTPFPVLRIPIDEDRAAAPSTRMLLEALVLSQGRQLAHAVSAIARAEGPVVLRCGPDEISTGLVTALTLLAAGAEVGSVLADFTPVTALLPHDPRSISATDLAHALRVIDRFNGVECYLLRNGVSVEDFHALRDKYEERHDEP